MSLFLPATPYDYIKKSTCVKISLYHYVSLIYYMEQLHLFSAGSANDDSNKHLWVKGAALFIPQLTELLTYTNYQFTPVDISYFQAQLPSPSNNAEKVLGDILAKHQSDKSVQHNYHIVYSFIFNKLSECLTMLEIGMGTNNPSLVSSMGSSGRPGASLYAFREYLPHATIYGADIDRDILAQIEWTRDLSGLQVPSGLKTCYVDQLDRSTFDAMNATFGNSTYDLIIDDGLHSIGANLNTLLFALDHLNPHGWIVIEDIHIINNWKCIDFILRSTNTYKTYIVKTRHAYLYVVNKL